MATAETPKRSFKRTVASTVEERSPRFLLGSLALAMVIALIAGLGIGVKIGEHGKNTPKTAAVNHTPTTKKRIKVVTAFAPPPIKGVVVRSLPKALVLSSAKRRISLAYIKRTRVEATAVASRSDIKAGSRVVFALEAKAPTATTGATGATGATGTAAASAFTAKEILIVTGAGAVAMGSLVSKVTSDSMIFKGAKGRLISISTVGAVVRKTVPATKAKLTVGRHVLVRAIFSPAPKKAKKAKKAVKAAKRQRIAVEVVVLPGDSTLG